MRVLNRGWVTDMMKKSVRVLVSLYAAATVPTTPRKHPGKKLPLRPPQGVPDHTRPSPASRPRPAAAGPPWPRPTAASARPRPTGPPRPRRVPGPGAPPQKGDWLWTTRPGSEIDLIEELAFIGVDARQVEVALVVSGKCPSGFEPAFARQLLPVAAICAPTAAAVHEILRPHLGGPCALHVWVPDSDPGNLLSSLAADLQRELRQRLEADRPGQLLDDGPAAKEAGGRLLQVCLLSAEEAAVGALRAVDAQSLAPGGRLRFHVDREAPSRSAMKLGEALAWLGRGPEPEDVCVDLGASPGGWTYIIAQRRAHVVAVDPGLLAPSLRNRKGIEHLRMDAFRFEPELPADWLFCDMAFRPLEVASLLAKWGRKHWARFLLANIKLPMRKRAEMMKRVKEILKTGGWTGVRVRQLYHDRDEVTVAAWRGFGIDARAPGQRATPATGDAVGGDKTGARKSADTRRSAKPTGKTRPPRPSANTSPRPSSQDAPRSFSKTSPRPSSKTRPPRPSANTSPRPSANAAPRPFSKTTPRPSSKTRPPRPSSRTRPPRPPSKKRR